MKAGRGNAESMLVIQLSHPATPHELLTKACPRRVMYAAALRCKEADLIGSEAAEILAHW